MRCILLCCLIACLPVFAATGADTRAAPSAKAIKASHRAPATKAGPVSKPGRFVSPEDYDFDHLLRCAVGCWG
jgi:hypothetical protein